jgi:hypothetical protein
VLLGELLQRVGVGRRAGLRLLHRDEAELLEQDAAQLRRGVHVELLARVRVDLGLEPPALVVELLAELLQELEVDADARVFHLREHAHERALDALVEIDELARLERLGERVGEAEQDARAAPVSSDRVAVEIEGALDLVGRGELERQVAQREVSSGTSPRPDRAGTPSPRCRALERAQVDGETVHQLLGAVRDERRAVGPRERVERVADRLGSVRRSPSM